MSRNELAIEHESAFVRSFIVRDQRERFLSQLASTKKRASFLDRLNHRLLADLDDRYISKSQPVALPAPDDLCCIIADESRYDAQIVPVSDAGNILAAAHFGVIVSYIPGKLAAYKDEAPADVIWLARP